MSATVKVHGMDGTLVEPDWPALMLAEVRTLLARFPDLTEPIEILSASPRPLSAAGVVSTSGGRVLNNATNTGFFDKIQRKFACFYHTDV